MNRPTDEQLWAQFAGCAVAQYRMSKSHDAATWASEVADRLLQKHRERFPKGEKP